MYSTVLIFSMFYITVFLFGIVIGSFLNVCILRIPQKQSIVPSSHCMECGHKLAWYDMIPVLSYVMLGGKCRYCKSGISVQYPLVEALNGFLYLLVAGRYGWSIETIIYCLLASALVVISLIDIRTFEIPIGANIFILVLGIVRVVTDISHIADYLLGIVAICIPLLIIYYLSGGRGIGGGDVKLMGAAGLVLGWENIVLAFVLGCIIGSVIHLLRMKLTKADNVLALGPYLSVGIMIAALWGSDMLNWYLTNILY